jgi:hypothetical protein
VDDEAPVGWRGLRKSPCQRRVPLTHTAQALACQSIAVVEGSVSEIAAGFAGLAEDPGRSADPPVAQQPRDMGKYQRSRSVRAPSDG